MDQKDSPPPKIPFPLPFGPGCSKVQIKNGDDMQECSPSTSYHKDTLVNANDVVPQNYKKVVTELIVTDPFPTELPHTRYEAQTPPIYPKIAPKSITIRRSNRKKPVTSVASYLERDTIEKKLEILEQLSPESIISVITKVMQCINNCCGNYLEAELVGIMGVATYSTFGKASNTKSLTKYMFMDRKAGMGRFLRLDPDGLVSGNGFKIIRLQNCEAQSKTSSLFSIVSDQPSIFQENGELVAEVDTYISRKIDMLKKNEMELGTVPLQHDLPDDLFDSPLSLSTTRREDRNQSDTDTADEEINPALFLSDPFPSGPRKLLYMSSNCTVTSQTAQDEYSIMADVETSADVVKYLDQKDPRLLQEELCVFANETKLKGYCELCTKVKPKINILSNVLLKPEFKENQSVNKSLAKPNKKKKTRKVTKLTRDEAGKKNSVAVKVAKDRPPKRKAAIKDIQNETEPVYTWTTLLQSDSPVRQDKVRIRRTQSLGIPRKLEESIETKELFQDHSYAINKLASNSTLVSKKCKKVKMVRKCLSLGSNDLEEAADVSSNTNPDSLMCYFRDLANRMHISKDAHDKRKSKPQMKTIKSPIKTNFNSQSYVNPIVLHPDYALQNVQNQVLKVGDDFLVTKPMNPVLMPRQKLCTQPSLKEVNELTDLNTEENKLLKPKSNFLVKRPQNSRLANVNILRKARMVNIKKKIVQLDQRKKNESFLQSKVQECTFTPVVPKSQESPKLQSDVSGLVEVQKPKKAKIFEEENAQKSQEGLWSLSEEFVTLSDLAKQNKTCLAKKVEKESVDTATEGNRSVKAAPKLVNRKTLRVIKSMEKENQLNTKNLVSIVMKKDKASLKLQQFKENNLFRTIKPSDSMNSDPNTQLIKPNTKVPDYGTSTEQTALCSMKCKQKLFKKIMGETKGKVMVARSASNNDVDEVLKVTKTLAKSGVSVQLVESKIDINVDPVKEKLTSEGAYLKDSSCDSVEDAILLSALNKPRIQTEEVSIDLSSSLAKSVDKELLDEDTTARNLTNGSALLDSSSLVAHGANVNKITGAKLDVILPQGKSIRTDIDSAFPVTKIKETKTIISSVLEKHEPKVAEIETNQESTVATKNPSISNANTEPVNEETLDKVVEDLVQLLVSMKSPKKLAKIQLLSEGAPPISIQAEASDLDVLCSAALAEGPLLDTQAETKIINKKLFNGAVVSKRIKPKRPQKVVNFNIKKPTISKTEPASNNSPTLKSTLQSRVSSSITAKELIPQKPNIAKRISEGEDIQKYQEDLLTLSQENNELTLHDAPKLNNEGTDEQSCKSLYPCEIVQDVTTSRKEDDNKFKTKLDSKLGTLENGSKSSIGDNVCTAMEMTSCSAAIEIEPVNKEFLNDAATVELTKRKRSQASVKTDPGKSCFIKTSAIFKPEPANKETSIDTHELKSHVANSITEIELIPLEPKAVKKFTKGENIQKSEEDLLGLSQEDKDLTLSDVPRPNNDDEEAKTNSKESKIEDDVSAIMNTILNSVAQTEKSLLETKQVIKELPNERINTMKSQTNQQNPYNSTSTDTSPGSGISNECFEAFMKQNFEMIEELETPRSLAGEKVMNALLVEYQESPCIKLGKSCQMHVNGNVSNAEMEKMVTRWQEKQILIKDPLCSEKAPLEDTPVTSRVSNFKNRLLSDKCSSLSKSIRKKLCKEHQALNQINNAFNKINKELKDYVASRAVLQQKYDDLNEIANVLDQKAVACLKTIRKPDDNNKENNFEQHKPVQSWSPKSKKKLFKQADVFEGVPLGKIQKSRSRLFETQLQVKEVELAVEPLVDAIMDSFSLPHDPVEIKPQLDENGDDGKTDKKKIDATKKGSASACLSQYDFRNPRSEPLEPLPRRKRASLQLPTLEKTNERKSCPYKKTVKAEPEPAERRRYFLRARVVGHSYSK